MKDTKISRCRNTVSGEHLWSTALRSTGQWWHEESRDTDHPQDFVKRCIACKIFDSPESNGL